MSTTVALSPSQLIFPSAHTSISSTLTTLERSNLSITNRLQSIKSDFDFVQTVAQAYELPLIANERCGSWYIPPSKKAGSAYFKSTDGHHGQWSFSLRRLNLQVLHIIGENGGCIIVDSTRRGKTMPDALSKTVPIWICSLNRLLFPEIVAAHSLRTPEDVVSRSEDAQMSTRIQSFVADIEKLDLDLTSLRSELHGRTLKPTWVTPDSDLLNISPRTDDCHLVVLCTASGCAVSSTQASSSYVQGAADDSESWAHGLSAADFWAHSRQLLTTSEDDLPVLMQKIVAESAATAEVRSPTLIKPTSSVWIGNNACIQQDNSNFDVVIACSQAPNEALAANLKDRYVHLKCASGKVGSRQLRGELSKYGHLAGLLGPRNRVLVCCPTGRDLAVGAALALICSFCSADGSLHASRLTVCRDKAQIKKRLSWIMISIPDAAPSRATLQSVNAYLLSQNGTS